MRFVQRPGEPATVLLRGARILDPGSGVDREGDLLVKHGRIAPPAPAPREVDARGLVVTPSFVDLHVHLRVPGGEDAEDLRTGTAAAARGGFGLICAMPNTDPVVDSGAVLGALLDRGTRECLVPTGFYGSITRGLAGEQLSEMGELAELGCVGFTDDGRPVASANVLRRALQYSKITGRLVALHEEDPTLARHGDGHMHEGAVATRLGVAAQPGLAESAMVARDVAIARYEDVAIHICHLSTLESVEVLRAARARGQRVTAEATPHHLLLTDAAVEATLDPARVKMNPPLRPEADRRALLAALLDGTVDAVATDHAPHPQHTKEVPFEAAPFGVIGLETAFAALHDGLVRTGELPLEVLIERLTAGPARVLGIAAPRIAEDEVANLTVIDPREEWTVARLASRSTNTPWLDRTLTGRVKMTIAQGVGVFDELTD